MINIILQTLSTCGLFSSLTSSEISEISTMLSNLPQGGRTQNFAPGEVVAFEEDACSAMGIVISGSIHIQRIYADGKLITIETFGSGDSFGEALMFADSATYPATLVAKEKTRVMYIPRDVIIQLCSRYPRFLDHFMRVLSNRVLLLNHKIKNLSFQSIRQKVANYLLEESLRQKSDHLTLSSGRNELADSLGVPRPSLSRELISMKAAGWIDFDRRAVRILDKNALEHTLKS